MINYCYYIFISISNFPLIFPFLPFNNQVIFGILLFAQPDYMPKEITNKSTAGSSMITAGFIYGLFGVISFFMYRKQTKQSMNPFGDDLTEYNKFVTPARKSSFTQASKPLINLEIEVHYEYFLLKCLSPFLFHFFLLHLFPPSRVQLKKLVVIV